MKLLKHWPSVAFFLSIGGGFILINIFIPQGENNGVFGKSLEDSNSGK